MIQQQKSGRALAAEFRHTLSAYGPLKPLKGLSATVLRESLYASGYLAVAPLLREALQQQPALADVPGGPLVVSGVAAGLLATVCTQPADTVKTRMQVRGGGAAAARWGVSWPGGPPRCAPMRRTCPRRSNARPPVALACSCAAPSMQAFPEAATHPQYRSLLSTTEYIIRNEGVGTLFAGLGPRSFRIVCAGGGCAGPAWRHALGAGAGGRAAPWHH